MPSASPVPLPTPSVVPTSAPTHTTNDPYGLPHASEVFVERKRRGVAPPPLQMPEMTGNTTNPSPVPGVSSPHYTPQHPQMPQAYMGNVYHHSPMAVPQHAPSMPQYPHTPHMPPHMTGPMTPATPMVMTPMSGPHPGGFEGCPPPPPHAHHVPSGYHGMGLSSPMTPMTPMSLHTSMSFLSDSGSQTPHMAQPGMVPHPSTQGMYTMPPQQFQNMYEVADGHHSPTMSHSPMAPSPMSGHSTPTYAPTYPTTYEMYPVQQMQPQYTNVPVQQVPYGYEGYGAVEGNVMPQMIDGDMYGDDASRDRRLRRNRGKKEENQAVDAVRYKTKMCRNWELTNRCPYGPRCLFAHGRPELRSAAINTEAICTAARSTSPKRAFYENGRFPEFVPMPTELMTQMANERTAPINVVNAPSAIELAGQMA